jgi:hypothetical protein
MGGYLRRGVAVLALCLVVLVPLLIDGTLPTWTAAFHQARCLGPCCLVVDDFVELSCGEYSPPNPSEP